MPEIAMDTVIRQLVSVLREAFEGPQERWSYFTDNRPGAGLFGTRAPLRAADASRPLNGTTIAAHVHHVVWAMSATFAWIWGDRTPRNWQVSTVDDAAWRHLLEELRRKYAELRRTIESHASSSEEAFGEAIAVIAHVAYHLGAIRQKVAAFRTS